MLKWMLLSAALVVNGLLSPVAAQGTATALTAGDGKQDGAAARDGDALAPLVPDTAAASAPPSPGTAASSSLDTAAAGAPSSPGTAPSSSLDTAAASAPSSPGTAASSSLDTATAVPPPADTAAAPAETLPPLNPEVGMKKATAAAVELDATPSDGASPDPLAPAETAGPAPVAPGAPPAAAQPPQAVADAAKVTDPIVTQIRAQLAASRDPSRADDREDFNALKAFYNERDGEPVWTGKEGFNARAALAVAEIRKAGDWGLEASAFELPEAPQAGAAVDALATADIKLSLALLKYARYARGGRLDPPALSPSFDRRPRIYEPKSVMQAVAAADAADAYLRGLHPKFPQFERLRQALQSMHKIAGAADVNIPSGQNIKPGGQHPHVALLRQRLKLTAEVGKEMLYDEALVEAVKGIQRDRGLKPTGTIDRSLRNALNDTAAEAPDQKRWRILANMERWRWMPEDLGKFYVWDNLPEQMTRVFDNGKVVLTEKIVIGKPGSPTPLFSANMQFVIFHPEWGVPDGIKTNEIGPKLRNAGGGFFFSSGGCAILRGHGLKVMYNGREVDPDSVDWSSVDVRRYQFIQPAGSSNVLGVVKFRFPNKHDVYMHDTPERHLFGQAPRAFSHGCMRVQNPVHLAEVLLAHDKGWSADKVRGMAAGSGNTNEVTLSTQIPVHIVYFTVDAGEDGKLQYHKDIYGHDSRVIAALKGTPMPVLSSASDADNVASDTPQPRQQTQQRQRTRTVNKPWSPFGGMFD
jgi:murein L,D-transpeptidase YcbB/YkuD